MSLKLNTASGGSISLQETNTASNFTLTVPAVTANLLTNRTPGTVLQVVNATYGTSTSSASSTFADIGLTATITPSSSSSKILVMVTHNGCRKDTSNTTLQIRLLRNGTKITGIEDNGGRNGDNSTNQFGGVSMNYLDSPATTSALTYKTQFASTNNTGNVYVNDFFAANGETVSTITLMEIAA
jgi:hypothetical protein